MLVSALSVTMRVGKIQPFAVSSLAGVPRGWLPCFGQLVDIADYPLLYAAIGSTYLDGQPSVSGSFYLPNMVDGAPVGVSATILLAARGGELTHTLQLSEIAAHDHGAASGGMSANTLHSHGNTTSANDSGHTHTMPSVSGGAGGNTGASYVGNKGNPNSEEGALLITEPAHGHGSSTTSSASTEHTHTTPVDGQSVPHDNKQPYIVAVWCIHAGTEAI